MPTNRQKRSRYSKPSLSRELRDYFESGSTDNETIELYVIRIDRNKLQSIWTEHKEKILEKWIRDFPGFRPFIWWKFDAPGMRKRIGGGEGEPTKKTSDLGVPDGWFFYDFKEGRVRLNFNKHDPPVFESECAYLQRHGLLTPIEEKITAEEPELLKPVAITDIFSFEEI